MRLLGLDIHTSHRTILLLPLSIYLFLVLIVAWLPAEHMLRAYPPESAPPIHGNPADVARGEQVYKANNCSVCHTQQIRGDERLKVQVGDRWQAPVRAPDARFGLDEPTRPEQYAASSPPMLGTQRTGPDLTGVGDRLPRAAWHYWHLYKPRSVSPDSVMPASPWLFQVVPRDGAPPLEQPVGTPLGLLVVFLVVGLFVGSGWLLFGRTRSLLFTAALGVGAGWLILEQCQLCKPPPGGGEVVEDEIDGLGLAPDEQLVATPDGKALVEYLLSLRRPLRRN